MSGPEGSELPKVPRRVKIDDPGLLLLVQYLQGDAEPNGALVVYRNTGRVVRVARLREGVVFSVDDVANEGRETPFSGEA